MKTTLSAAMLAIFLTSTPAFAGNEVDVDNMTTYAALLGRAEGCGINTYTWRRGVANWMSRRFDAELLPSMMEIFAMGYAGAMKDQRAGRSPDPCVIVKQTVMSTAWPE